MQAQKYNVNNVRPKRWSNPVSLFDNGEYALIWGAFDGYQTLGVRWNGDIDSPRGYPGQGSHPTWYNEPDFLVKPILNELLLNDEKSKYINEKEIRKILKNWNPPKNS